MGTYDSIFGKVRIRVTDHVVLLLTSNTELCTEDIETIMKDYIYQNPDGGKMGGNEVQKPEFRKSNLDIDWICWYADIL